MQRMQIAGGLLNYGGTFLTQFFYYPFVGSTLFGLLLLLVQYLVKKAFEIPKPYLPLTFIPSFALLLSLTEVFEVLFALKSPGYLFSNTLGVIACLSAFLLYRKINSSPIKITVLSLFIILTYPLFGFYTLFTGLLCVIYEIKRLLSGRKNVVITVVTGLLTGMLILLVPYLFFSYVYTQMPLETIYIAGLPQFYFTKEEFTLWLPFIVLFLSLLLFSVGVFKTKKEKKAKKTTVFSLGIFVLCLIGLYFLSYHSENFKTELKMKQAIENNRWKEVVAIGNKQKGNPTRQIILSYNLALYKLGLAGDKMFFLDNQSIPSESRRSNLLMINTIAKMIYFQYGKINFSYRWCMENMVEYGMNTGDLKYMVKCTLMNGERELAQKYNNVLKKTLFHKQWAEKYQTYIDHPELMLKDEEMKAIEPLLAYDDLLDGDENLLEKYLLNHFANMQGGSLELLDLSIQCNLVLKNIERFWPLYYSYIHLHERIPVHYQEAAILYAALENKDKSNLKLDANVVERYDRMFALTQSYAGKSEDFYKKALKPKFGNTFWYYYFFTTGMTTN
jgi:hypothetical protein